MASVLPVLAACSFIILGLRVVELLLALFASGNKGIVGRLLNHSCVDKVREEDSRILVLLRYLAGLSKFLLHHIQPSNLGADLVLFGEFV